MSSKRIKVLILIAINFILKYAFFYNYMYNVRLCTWFRLCSKFCVLSCFVFDVLFVFWVSCFQFAEFYTSVQIFLFYLVKCNAI